ncbi:MAG TPA: GNAT family N-acetyltransferase [Stellaceae bacterium]|jgi:GNAT superfamily N-acetyltransferase|nr:GNAT family N-acetyltransferase [Stellaceae bacterium]
METRIGEAEGAADIGVARGLIEEYARSLPFSLDFQNFAAELGGLPAPYAPPGGCLLLAWQGAPAVGIVALKPLAPGVGEVKRLYVVPAARGTGLGRVLLECAIDAASERGYTRLRLDSHRASMGAAIRLYQRLGFVEIAPYGPDLGGALAFFEKDLAG